MHNQSSGSWELCFTLLPIEIPLPQPQLKFAGVCKLCETVSAFKHRISVQFIEQQSPLGMKTFNQGIYTKQLTFGVFKNHWNLRYVDPSFYEEPVFFFRQHCKQDFAKPYFTL